MVIGVLMEFGKPTRNSEMYGKLIDKSELIESWIGYEIKGLGIVKKAWEKDNKIYGEIELTKNGKKIYNNKRRRY